MRAQGRIIKGVGGSYEVSADGIVYTCSAKGIFRNRGETPLVGDRVEVDILDEREYLGNIVRILERTNTLKRPRVANVDQALIVFAVTHPAINIDLLDRFLIVAENEGVDAVIVLNKADMCDGTEPAHLRSIYEGIGYKVIVMSAYTQAGVEELRERIEGRVSVLAGPSGVGKSSIVNCISDREMETGELSRKIARGKHTTRHAELIQIAENTFVVDSPGFTSLEIDALESDELAYCFREFRPFIGECRFNNCKHQHEPDCAIKAQVGKAITNDRYERYKGLLGGVGYNS